MLLHHNLGLVIHIAAPRVASVPDKAWLSLRILVVWLLITPVRIREVLNRPVCLLVVVLLSLLRHWIWAVHFVRHHHLPEWVLVHLRTWTHVRLLPLVHAILRVTVSSLLVAWNLILLLQKLFFSFFLNLPRSAIRKWPLTCYLLGLLPLQLVPLLPLALSFLARRISILRLYLIVRHEWIIWPSCMHGCLLITFAIHIFIFFWVLNIVSDCWCLWINSSSFLEWLEFWGLVVGFCL